MDRAATLFFAALSTSQLYRRTWHATEGTENTAITVFGLE